MNIVKELNIVVFKFFNENFGHAKFDVFLETINAIAYPRHAHYHLFFALAIASIWIYRKRNNQDSLKELLILCSSATLTFTVSLTIGLGIVQLLKLYTSVARPYCILDNINTLKYYTTAFEICHESFPSGHTAFSTIAIVSFWPLLNRFFKSLAVAFLGAVMVSRMASGAHFPMDLIGALVICLPLTLYIREKMSKIVINYESRWNIFKKFFKVA